MGVITDTVDTVLDKSVVLGYSRVGPMLRSSWWPADPPAVALRGKDVLVTGGSGGLGLAAAIQIAQYGARVHLVGRTADRLESAAEQVRREVPGADVLAEVCDVSDLDSVRAVGAGLRDRLESLHAIVHDAGIMPSEREESAQGHELTLATHVIGPLALTEELRPLLRAAGSARVVIVSSGGMYTAAVDQSLADDLEYRQGTYRGIRAYARTKRLQVVMGEELATRLADDAIAVHSMHPGWADTPGIADAMPGFARVTSPILRDADDGADTISWLVASADAGEGSGLFWSDRRPRPTHYLPCQEDDPSARAQVWAACLAAVGLR